MYKVTIDVFDKANEDRALETIKSCFKSTNKNDFLEINEDFPQFNICFHKKSDYENFVNAFTDKIYTLDFTDNKEGDIIKPYEIDVNLDHPELNKDQYFFMKRQLDRANDELSIMEFALSESNETLDNIQERLSEIEEYLAYSGLIYYQSFFSSLLKELEEQGIIDLDNIDTTLVEQVH